MIELIAAAVFSLHIHGASIHPGDRTQYNESNYGIGFRYGNWQADAFLDSHGNPAGFAGRVYEREHEGLKWGVTAAWIEHTHYSGPGPIPQVRWEGKYVGVRMIFAPSIDGGVYGFSLTIPIK